MYCKDSIKSTVYATDMFAHNISLNFTNRGNTFGTWLTTLLSNALRLFLLVYLGFRLYIFALREESVMIQTR